MKKILIVMDDINYRGGAHYATFKIANFLNSIGNSVHIFSPIKASLETQKNINEDIQLITQTTYHGYDYVVVPFENSRYREEISNLNDCVKILWIHNDYERWKDVVGLDIKKEEIILQKFDKIVFVSNYIKEGFLKLFPSFVNKCFVAYNFIDTEKIITSGEEFVDDEIFVKQDEETLNIVIAGRLEPQKAYHRLIDVVKIINERGLKTNWFVLGEGYEYSELRNRCEKYSINNVHFLGYRSNPYPFIKKADLFAILSEYEGFGLVIVESLILGVPVLSTDSGVVSEVLPRKYGWIADNNIYAIVDAICSIYSNREELKLKTGELSSYSYDNDKVVEEIMDIFDLNEPKELEKHYPKLCNQKTAVPQVSVIVPVYNMESYLVECLDSLVNQSFSDMEIIVVNDGSTDKSINIIDDYVYKYPNKIRAFSIKNSGLGEARNYGITKAKGEYIGFVDSDDAVRQDTFELLYKYAKKDHADFVLCDYIACWEDGKSEYVSALSSNNIDRFEFLKYSTKYGLVNACTKLLHRDLFQFAKFPKGFYEDLATIPILMSYSKNISYVKEGLYYYRQRSGSITSVKNNDKRLLDSYTAWDRILKLSNPLLKKEITFAVYWSMNFFCTNFLDEFMLYSKKYFDKNINIFNGNEYIQETIRKKELLDFGNLAEIPKIIHYCWFGNNPKNQLIQSCLESWRKYAPDFEIIEWNEENCDIHVNKYVEKAYEEKKWAFVSDYFRLKVLYEYGGIYMDTDMELMKSIEPYLFNQAFFAFETPIFVHAGIIGAVKKSDIIHRILSTYENEEFCIGELNMPLPIPRRITEILEKNTNLVKNGKTQLLTDDIKVYSANLMTMNFHDGNCVTNHHYEGDWLKNDKTSSANYGYNVMKHYFTWDLLNASKDVKLNINNTIGQIGDGNDYKALYEQIVSSTSWKLTKPLRKIVDILRKH